MREALSLPQKRVLRAVHAAIQRDGFPPTVRELTSGLGHSAANSTMEVLQRLRRKGLVSWRPGASRTLALTEAGKGALR